MSRSDINKGDRKIYEHLWAKHKKLPTITFKDYLLDELLHFGNTEGSNIYTGKNIIVAGTPHQNEIVYKRIAHTLGFDVNDKLKHQKVTYNGYIFWFYAYTNENLRDIQFWLIESELEQAVGRARLLRKDCVVYLYSNFPLSQSILDDSDSDNGTKPTNSDLSGEA